jgi:hypothetical protein
MKTSRHFKRALYHDQSPSIADYFEIRHSSLFVTDSLQSWLEVCVADSLPPRGKFDREPDESDWSPLQPEKNNYFNEEAVIESTPVEWTAVWTEKINHKDQIHGFVKVGSH